MRVRKSYYSFMVLVSNIKGYSMDKGRLVGGLWCLGSHLHFFCSFLKGCRI